MGEWAIAWAPVGEPFLIGQDTDLLHCVLEIVRLARESQASATGESSVYHELAHGEVHTFV